MSMVTISTEYFSVICMLYFIDVISIVNQTLSANHRVKSEIQLKGAELKMLKQDWRDKQKKQRDVTNFAPNRYHSIQIESDLILSYICDSKPFFILYSEE